MRRVRKITVVGLGQIGGSLVLALRRSCPSLHITGIDIAPHRIRELRHALDAAGSDWKKSFDADLAIVCLHFREIINYLRAAPRDLLIADTCSGKKKVLADANRRQMRFVGTHPLAGNEHEGERGWDANLFRNAPFFVCAGKFASGSDTDVIRKIARSIGAHPIAIDAAKHDQWVAVSSHLPALLARRYQEFAAAVPSVFCGPGFRSFTRLATTSPLLLQTFLDSNGENIRKVLHRWNRQVKDRTLKIKTQTSRSKR